MGVKATVVMPLMKEGRTMGPNIVDASQRAASRSPYEMRMATELLSHMLSLLMGRERGRRWRPSAAFAEPRSTISSSRHSVANLICSRPWAMAKAI